MACSGFSTNLISHVCYKRWTTLPVLISGSSAELRNTDSSKITRHQNGHPLKRNVSCMHQMIHITSLCILSIQRIYGFGTVLSCLGLLNFCTCILGTAVAQLLRCCAKYRKVAGSIPDGVIGIFHWHSPSDRTVALGSTQPLTEMSTGNISWG